jgi:hypothetical protein
MIEVITVPKQIERRTYLKGKFKGQFIGYLDYRNSDLKHENFYDLEVIVGQITAERGDFYHWETGEPEMFQIVDKFLTVLPDSLPCKVLYTDGNFKNFRINLNDIKLTEYALSNQSYEGRKVYGDIEGDISGFIRHYDTEYVEVLVGEDEPTVIKTKTETGELEKLGGYTRHKQKYSNGESYWGDWKYQSANINRFWEVLSSILGIALLALFVIPILIAGWKVILPLAIIVGFIYLLSLFRTIITTIWHWLIRLLTLGFILFFFYGIVQLVNSAESTTAKKEIIEEDVKEVTKIKSDPLVIKESIISHHRIWNDYANNTYSGNLEIKTSDLKMASNFRNNQSTDFSGSIQYNSLVSRIYDFDKNKLDRIYKMFDSLKVNSNLNKIQFAEVITSCIQDIPYTLILDNACDAKIYNDAFIADYLKSGGECEGYTKFGLLTPIEFMGSLKGDCDTRTLLLFTILNHYRYDVAMFGSEVYRHSVIGINLPYEGVSKIVNGNRYVFWETTARGIRPGFFPSEISDTRFWNVNLISNNQSI